MVGHGKKLTQAQLNRTESALGAALHVVEEFSRESRLEVSPDGRVSITHPDEPPVALDVPPLLEVERPEGRYVIGGSFPPSEDVFCVDCQRRIRLGERMAFEVWREGQPVCSECAGEGALIFRWCRALMATLVHVGGTVTDRAVRSELEALCAEEFPNAG